MKTYKLFLATACIVMCLSQHARAVVIDFDNLADHTVVTNQYPDATFSSIAGQNVVVSAHPASDTPPNLVCTSNGTINCTKPVFVDFPQPVNNLKFEAREVNTLGVQSTVRIYNAGGLIGSVDLNGGGIAFNVSVDLSAFANIKRIEMLGPNGVGDLDASGNGIGWDTFRFDVATVPEPATASCGIVAMLCSMLVRRRSASRTR